MSLKGIQSGCRCFLCIPLASLSHLKPLGAEGKPQSRRLRGVNNRSHPPSGRTGRGVHGARRPPEASPHSAMTRTNGPSPRGHHACTAHNNNTLAGTRRVLSHVPRRYSAAARGTYSHLSSQGYVSRHAPCGHGRLQRPCASVRPSRRRCVDETSASWRGATSRVPCRRSTCTASSTSPIWQQTWRRRSARSRFNWAAARLRPFWRCSRLGCTSRRLLRLRLRPLRRQRPRQRW